MLLASALELDGYLKIVAKTQTAYGSDKASKYLYWHLDIMEPWQKGKIGLYKFVMDVIVRSQYRLLFFVSKFYVKNSKSAVGIYGMDGEHFVLQRDLRIRCFRYQSDQHKLYINFRLQ